VRFRSLFTVNKIIRGVAEKLAIDSEKSAKWMPTVGQNISVYIF
jgi:hypothetical protein